MSSTNSPRPPKSATGITNIVVLMLENRSYDNVLGWLYGAGNAAPYDKAPPGQRALNGLTGTESNPDPYGGEPLTVANRIAPTGIPGEPQTWPATAVPVIDPGEVFDDMAQQFTGTKPQSNPYAGGFPAGVPAMSGFTVNYAVRKKMSAANIGDVMNYFTPAQLPVSAYLANHFAVCDSWFASVPTQTFTNRAFAHCAAPGVMKHVLGRYFSLIDDVQYVVDGATQPLVELPSVMQYLDQNLPPGDTPNWRVYFHDYSISMMTVPYVANAAASGSNANVCTFSTQDYGSRLPKGLGRNPSNFLADVENGTLPPYSFIEPRYARGHSPADPPPSPNSNHPGPSAYYTVFGVTETDPPVDAASGELLLMQVFNALRNSEKYWPGTLLIVTYDEPGGIYDHVAPVDMTPPGKINWNGVRKAALSEIPAVEEFASAADGFRFNVSGGRVPAIVVSPLAEACSTLLTSGTPFDHSSLVRTVLDTFCSTAASLNERDAAAPSVLASLRSDANNQTPAFSGIILTAPSSLTFQLALLEESTVQILQASAGGPALSVSTTLSAPWLTASLDAETGIVTVAVNIHGQALKRGTIYQTTFTICATGPQAGIAPVTVPVSLLPGIL